MAPLLLFVIVVGGMFLRGMSSDERIELLKRAVELMKRARAAIVYIPPGCRAFNDALRMRTRWAIVTPSIALANVVIVVLMLFGPGSFSDRDTLLAWGASYGPRTTNGEWWRLLSSMFVHAGVVHALVSVAGTLRVGLMLERLIGPVSFATTYVAAGVIASLASLAAHPVAVHASASGAIFGIYGLLFASIAWGLIQRSEVTIPVAAIRQVAPGAAVFLLYTFVTEGFVTPAMVAGISVGSVCGFVLAGRVSSSKPPVRRVLATMAATAGIVVLLAVPLRGVADVTGEVAFVVAFEDRTSRDYDADVMRFKRGRLSSDDLIAQIDRIQPELRAVSLRLNSVGNIPPEHQWLVDTAKEYLRLREESWRLRAEALRGSNMRQLQQADTVEHAAIAVLDKIRPADRD